METFYEVMFWLLAGLLALWFALSGYVIWGAWFSRRKGDE